MSFQTLKVVVIGGGAAGFFGAIACAQTNRAADITLLEASRQPLTKVLVSGGGRCNVTHACFDPAILVQNYPRGGKALRSAFSQFQAQDTVEWFNARNVRLKTEPDGRMFPITDNSATIAHCLIQQAQDAGINVCLGASVKSVVKHDDKFEIELRSGDILNADRLLIATGNSPQGYQIAKELGHTIEPTAPSLFTFNVTDDRLDELSGIAVDPVRLRLQVGDTKLEQTGALLVTHWGLSGPAVLKLSAWGARVLHEHRYQATLTVNWLPKQNPETLRQELLAVKSQLPRRSIVSSCPVILPRRLWEKLTATVGIQKETRWAELPNKTLSLLIQELTQGKYLVMGKGVFKEEFVTCGGINLKEVNFKTMESLCCPGLYLAGEVLDIDGVTGGFNFQSAWTTGYIAGQAMAREAIF